MPVYPGVSNCSGARLSGERCTRSGGGCDGSGGCCGWGQPGVAEGGAGEPVEEFESVLSQGGDVTAGGAEPFGAGHGAPAAGVLLRQLHRAQVARGLVVVERDSEVDGEPQHLLATLIEAGEQVLRFTVDFAV